MTGREMKVRVELTVTIDRDALEAEYGQAFDRDEVRDMVRDGVLTAALTPGLLFPEGIITEAHEKGADR